MEEKTGNTFTRNVSIAIAILVLFAISIAYITRDAGFKGDQENNLVGVDYTGEDDAVAIQKTAAFGDSLDGKMIFNNVCFVCHATGAAGAPQPGTEAMSQRAEKGLDALMQNTLNGLNAMPPRGGRGDLSDEQIQAVVEFMMQ